MMQNVLRAPSTNCSSPMLRPKAHHRASVQALAGKGFGTAPTPTRKSVASPNDSQQTAKTRKVSKQLLKEVTSQGTTQQRKPRQARGSPAQPINDKQAAEGKIDYVRVKDWGGGEPADLGELEVESYTPDLYADHSKPFYEQLARRLEDLQVRGMLNIAQPKSAKPLPPFEKWSFSEKRYIQYMCDQHNVHCALEEAVAASLEAGPHGPHAEDEAAQPSGECTAAFEALQCFSEPAGLDRSMQVAKDLDSLAKASNIANRSIEVTPTQQARACCEYMASLRDVAQEEPDEHFRQEAALRLIALAYALHVAHLTTGMRIGSAAGEKLNLFAANALNFYRSYPEANEPLEQFVSNVNRAGSLLTSEQQERVMNELPRAFPKISLLLTTLAHTT